MDSPEITGGDEGGTHRNPNRLRPSELALLRRMSGRFPFTQEDRVRAVGRVNDVLASDDSGTRGWLGAVKAMVSMEKINLDEMATLIAAMKVDEPLSNTVNVNVNTIQIQPSVVVQEALAKPEYLDYLEHRALGEDRDPGPVCQDGWKKLEDGPPPCGDLQSPGPGN